MEEHRQEIINTYGNKIRSRVCGLLFNGSEVLLIKHVTIGKNQFFYAPPGGGINFGESAEESLIREYREETGLEVRVKSFLFIHEYLNPPLHAIELFFEVEAVGGNLILGTDPEMTEDRQIIKEVKFWKLDEIQNHPPGLFHNLFRLANTKNELINLKGYFLQKGND